MSDPVNIQNWIFNAVSVFLIVEAVIGIFNAVVDKKDAKAQARIWSRSFFMIVAAVLIFYLNHATPVTVNFPKVRRNFNNGEL